MNQEDQQLYAEMNYWQRFRVSNKDNFFCKLLFKLIDRRHKNNNYKLKGGIENNGKNKSN